MRVADSTGAANLRTPSMPVRALLLLVAALALCAVVAWGLIVPGPFDWAISQPQSWQGGAEAALLLAGLALLQRVSAVRWRLLGTLLLAEFYLRRHAVDAPALLCVLYLEFTLALGAAVMRLCGGGRPRQGEDYLRAFVLGVSAWSMLAWLASALGWGTPVALRLVTLAMLPLACWARARPLSLHLLQRSRAWSLRDRVLLALLAGWVLVLFARANYVFSFDGLWYGFRPEYVLTADGSVFAPLGLVSPVHYFPKLYEVYLLPLSGLGDASVVSGMTILLLVLTALAGVRLLARCGVTSTTAQLLLAALVFTLPAIANPALEPKPDIACALFLLLAWLFAGDWLKSRRFEHAAWFLAAAMLAGSSKLIAVPYLGLLVIGIALTAMTLRSGPSDATAAPAQNRLAIAALLLALTVAAFVAARTWLLAGVPTVGPDPLYKIWTLFGMALREPAGTLTWAMPQDWATVPGLVVDWLLRPERMEHIAISWTGNVWLWLPLAALLLRARAVAADGATTTHRRLAWFLILAGIVIAVGWSHHTRGSDGNYFIAALVPALVLCVAFAWRQLHHEPQSRRFWLAGALLFCGFQAAYAFISASWTPGTRAFDLVLDRSPRDARKIAEGILAHAGLAEIGAWLRAQPGVARVVGCAPFDAATRLPARFEDFPTMAQSRPEYVADLDAALRYMRRFSIRYLLLPKPTPGSDAASQLIHGCTPHSTPPRGTRRVLENERYLLLEPVVPDSG